VVGFGITVTYYDDAKSEHLKSMGIAIICAGPFLAFMRYLWNHWNWVVDRVCCCHEGIRKQLKTRSAIDDGTSPYTILSSSISDDNHHPRLPLSVEMLMRQAGAPLLSTMNV
jgi:hypothetical protein